MSDCRKSLTCSRGIRQFFKDNNLDFSDFLKNGIQSKVLFATGDARAIRVIHDKRSREEKE